MKTIAIMQPYLFPYIGYYQLARCVDEFVLFDDVNYRKKSYINRNSILKNGNACPFSIPVRAISQNKKIWEHEYVNEFDGFLQILSLAYKDAPHFNEIYALVQEVLKSKSSGVTEVNSLSIRLVFDYLNLESNMSWASSMAISPEIKSKNRIIEICERKGAGTYVNAIGGQDLYDRSEFLRHGINLKFLKTLSNSYCQGGCDFRPHLSMLDVLMWNDKAKVNELLTQYELI